jgi:hypothetical protein
MTSVIPEMMYSSLKYQFIHTVNIKTKDTSELEMLCCNIKVINPTTGVEVLKNNQSMILGKTQGIIMNLVHGTKSSDEQTLTCKVKLQFGDCSYHYKMMHFAIRCEYFTPSNVNKPLVVAVSAPFQVFARRSKRSTGKRKVDLVDEDDYDFESLPPVEKKAKNTHNNTITLEQYQNAFEEMLAFKQRMQMDEGRVALQFVMARLIQANMPCDNHLSGNYPFNGHIESYFSDLLTPASTMPSLLEPAASEVYSSGSMTSLLMSGVVDPFANLQVPEMYESPVESPTDSESSALSDESSDIDWDHILEENVKDCQPSSHELLRVEQSNYQVANLC